MVVEHSPHRVRAYYADMQWQGQVLATKQLLNLVPVHLRYLSLNDAAWLDKNYLDNC